MLLMAVKPALTTRRCVVRGAPVGRRCVMSGSRRRVVFPVLVAHDELDLDAVAADAGEDGSGERPSWQRGVPIAPLGQASSTHGLKSVIGAPLLQMLLLLLLLRPSSGCSSTSSTR